MPGLDLHPSRRGDAGAIGRERTLAHILQLISARNASSESPRSSTRPPAGAAPSPPPAPGPVALPPAPAPNPSGDGGVRSGGWPVARALEAFGLLPEHVSALMAELQRQHGPTPPEAFNDQLALAAQLMEGAWRPVNEPATSGRAGAWHVLVGPPGVGKTTCLRKWLARAVLVEGRSVCVWRLDSAIVNTAEVLSLSAEMLGVPVQRTWPDAQPPAADLHLVDLPGVDWRDPEAVAEFAATVRRFPAAQLHLVLNAAYETRLLFDQHAALQDLGGADLIFTHLDEEIRRGKLWNFVLGTKSAIRFLSAGQNVPGNFQAATAAGLLPGAAARWGAVMPAAARPAFHGERAVSHSSGAKR